MPSEHWRYEGQAQGWGGKEPGIIQPVYRPGWLDEWQYHSRWQGGGKGAPFLHWLNLSCIRERPSKWRHQRTTGSLVSWTSNLGWRQVYRVWDIHGCEDFPGEWNYPGEINKGRTSLRTELWGIWNMKSGIWKGWEEEARPRQKEPKRTREAMSENHERTVFWKPMEEKGDSR